MMLAGCLIGCDTGSDGSSDGGMGDIGSNNPDVYSALGDSITAGGNGGGDPYPPRLSAMTGKTVVNRADSGKSSGAGLGEVGDILIKDKPAALLILLGANDVIGGSTPESIVANLRGIVQQAKANQTTPVVATMLPMMYVHELWAGEARALSSLIRSMASSEGARLVDLEAEFGSGEGLMLDDGLHPNEVGNEVIAQAFGDAL